MESMKSGAGRVWLAVAVGVLVVVGGIVLIGGNNGNTEDAAAPTATSAPEPPGTTLPTTTAPSPPPTAPPTTEPTVDADSLPAAGFGIREEDGTVTLFDLDGALLGTVETADVPPTARQLSIGLGEPPQLAATVPVAAEVPPGCDSTTADGGVHLALCGEESGLPQRLERMDPAGRSTEISGPPPAGTADSVLGHWRWAAASPDGRWVLASWSGECEAASGFLFSNDGAAGLTAEGSPIAQWQNAPENKPLGWAPDGRAIVALGHGLCGHGADEPGVHLVHPATGESQRIYESELGDDFLTWIRDYPYGNGLEKLAVQALDDLGYEQCCGEPSHGGPGVAAGAVFEGSDLAIGGVPTELSPLTDLGDPDQVVFGPGNAIVFGADRERAVGFVCGDATWTISWIFNPPPAEVDKLIRLGEALLPHLACTLRPPPA